MNSGNVPDYKISDAKSYLKIGDEHFKNGEFLKALECYDKAYISYLEIYGDTHKDTMSIYQKVKEATIKI